MPLLLQPSLYEHFNDRVLPTVLWAPPIQSLVFSPTVYEPASVAHAGLETIYAGVIGKTLLATVGDAEARALLTVAMAGSYQPGLTPPIAHYAADVEMHRRRLFFDDTDDVLPELVKLRATVAARARNLRVMALQLAGTVDRRLTQVARLMEALYARLDIKRGKIDSNVNAVAGKRGAKSLDQGIEAAARLVAAVALGRETDPRLFPYQPIPEKGGAFSCTSLSNFCRDLLARPSA